MTIIVDCAAQSKAVTPDGGFVYINPSNKTINHDKNPRLSLRENFLRTLTFPSTNVFIVLNEVVKIRPSV